MKRWDAKALLASNDAVQRLSQATETMIKKRKDDRLRFVTHDLQPSVKYMSSDGVHHTHAGEEMLAKGWARALPIDLARAILEEKMKAI